MSILRNRSGRNRSRLGVLVAALTLAASAAVVMTTATPASAAICSTISGSFTHRDNVSRVSFTATKDCSNHTVHVWGTLYDTACDSRSVHLEVKYSGGTFGNSVVNHGGGCNTSRSFDVSAGDGGSYVSFCMFAYNS
ncbi:MAG TPA: hypothetical protein VGO78_14110, partial [Acidimicrobiales bacterium]|nr:hypothetical protein [Acidimicrobiales bacterium]